MIKASISGKMHHQVTKDTELKLRIRCTPRQVCDKNKEQQIALNIHKNQVSLKIQLPLLNKSLYQ
jgi:hypothetical protein